MTGPPSPHVAAHPLRPDQRKLRPIRGLFALTAPVAPGLTATLAEALFCRTVRQVPRPDEAAFLARAEAFAVTAAGQTIHGYRWGTEGPLVVLAHGWWSHAGRFATMAEPLLAGGMRIAAFDAPGHGRSTGWRASMPEFAAALEAVVAHTGPARAVIGHSLGGAAIVYALSRGLPAERAVILSAPTDLQAWFGHFRELVGLDERVFVRMRENLERRLRFSWHDLDLTRFARTLPHPALVVHDRDDPDVPFTDGEALAAAWPGAHFLATEGLGHRAVLRDEEVVRRVVEAVV